MKFEESLKSGIFADLDRLARLLGVDRIEFIRERSYTDPLNTTCKIIAHKDEFSKAIMITSKAFDVDEDIILQQMRNLTKSLISEAILASGTISASTAGIATPGVVLEPRDEIRELLKKICIDWKVYYSEDNKFLIVESDRGKFKVNNDNFINLLIQTKVFEELD